jgi:uncharacterized protein YjdB
MKKIIFATAVAMISFFSCTKVSELENTSNPLPMPENVAVSAQGVEVSPKTNYVVAGEAETLTESYQPEEAQVGTVSWKSSDETVATVDANGKVTTLAVGVAHITATVDGVSASSLVNVFAERIPATEIKLSKNEVNLLVGRAANIKSGLLPENTTDRRNLEWSSSDEKVAVVSYGYIQAVGMGEATITAKQGDLTATVKVTVADKIKLVDRSEVWKITDTPKWDKNYYGTVTGSHEEVSVADFDGEYAYFGIVDASKFEGVEAVSNAVYEQVTDKKDAGKDPKDLFSTGKAFSKNYSDKGEAVAYLLAYDSEFEFTGEYAVYNFTAREPDPVHATGIKFTQGWNDDEITEITLKEGKSLSYFSAKLLPDDCTDTGSISFKSSDESVVKLSLYYNSYYTVTAVAEGEADIIATFNNIEASIHVTVTGNNITLTDHSATWAATKEVTEQWGWTIVNITVTACDAASFYATVTDEKPQGATLKGTLAAMADAASSSDIRSEVPATFRSWGGPDGRYIVILGYVSGDFSGDYAIIDTQGGTTPTPDPGTGGVSVNFDAQGQYLKNTFDDSDAVQDEVTLEGWFKPSSLTGGGDGIRALWGTEGIFLLRYEGSQLNLVYGGAKRTDKNEYNERKVTYTTNMAVNEWHHIAATYKRSEKARLYVDGVEVASNDAEDHAIELNGLGAQWDLPFSFIIGAAAQPKRNFLGSMAYLRVWNVARSASEIAANMNVASPDDDNFNLLAAWNFTEGSGNSIADSAYGMYPLTANSDLSWSSDALPF